MNAVEAGIEYLSVGANRHTAVADWSDDGVVAFGADSNIAVWQPHVRYTSRNLIPRWLLTCRRRMCG